VHVAHLLKTEYPANEALAEELATLRMPEWAKELFFPSLCLASGSTNECYDVATEMERQWRLQLLAELRAVNSLLKEPSDGAERHHA